MTPQASFGTVEIQALLGEFVARAQVDSNGNRRGLLAPEPAAGDIASLLALRFDIVHMMLNADPAVARSLLAHEIFGERGHLVSTGVLFEPQSALETKLYEEIAALYAVSWNQPNWVNLFACVQLCFQPFSLPFHPSPQQLPDDLFSKYMRYVLADPMLIKREDDARYVAHIAKALPVIERELGPDVGVLRRLDAFQLAMKNLSLNHLVHSDLDVRAILAERLKLIDRLNWISADTRLMPAEIPERAPRRPGERIRIGFYVRTILFGPDTNVLWSDICKLDLDEFEIFLYTLDSYDRSYTHDVDFYKKLFNVVSTVRSVGRMGVGEAVTLIRNDRLDIFCQSNATSLGVGHSDRLVSYRLAPVQVALNRIMALSTGLRSFDYFLAAPSPPQRIENFQSECVETVRAMPISMMAYTPPADLPPLQTIDRARLGLTEGNMVFLSGAAVDKLVPVLLDAWARILAALPEARLVLVPFNPAWGGRFFNNVLRHRLRVAFAPHGVDPRRVVLLDERHPRDVNQLLQLADVLLGSFPHAGATWLMKAMYFGVPPVVRGGPWLRGTGDQSFVRSVGLPELVGEETDDYVRIAIRLGSDAELRQSVRDRLTEASSTAPFLAPAPHSQQFAAVMQGLFAETCGSPVLEESCS